MESDAVEEFLQDRIFGSKEAVSTTLLSFQLGQTLTEATSTLQSFYESHRDTLDASYKVKTHSDLRTCIKVVDAKDLDPTQLDESRIWIVSAQGAADKAVIAAVSAKTQKLQVDLSIGRLKHLGLITNPSLESSFTISEGANPHLSHDELPVTTASAAPSPQRVKSEPPEEPRQATPVFKQPGEQKVPAVKKSPTAGEAGTKKKAPEPQKLKPGRKAAATSETPKKVKPSSSFFTEASKEEALKAMHRNACDFKPVHEAVVISDEVDDQGLDDYEANSSSKASKEEQMQALREGLFDDEGSDAEMADYEYDNLGDHVDASPDEDAMDVDNDPGALNAKSAEEAEEPETSKPSNDAKAEPRASSTESYETTAQRPQRPRTRRVKQNVIRKDEEGFDVHEEIWVDVPIESDSELGTPADPEAPQKSPLEDGDDKKESEITDVKRVAKAPPKMPAANKKQKTLMSFFGKK